MSDDKGRACQRRDLVGAHAVWERISGRVHRGLGIKSGLLRVLRPPPPRPPLGAPSRYAPGDWVRVLDEARVRATLDADARLRGLAFVPQMWSSCARVFRVQKQVRRMLDDSGRYRPITRTVMLEGVTCAGDGPEPAGCGRLCPIMFRDEWLEPAAAPAPEPARSPTTRARVRSLREIEAGLDGGRRRDGLMFMPEMAQYAGRTFGVVERIQRVYEYDRSLTPRMPVYLLEGLYCSGAIAGDAGPCDRTCALLWHGDWLEIEPTPGAP